jgi:hypothetical protein
MLLSQTRPTLAHIPTTMQRVLLPAMLRKQLDVFSGPLYSSGQLGVHHELGQRHEEQASFLTGSFHESTASVAFWVQMRCI